MNNTSWKDRLNVVKADINEYFQNHNAEYDLIVSNPPFSMKRQKDSQKKKYSKTYRRTMF